MNVCLFFVLCEVYKMFLRIGCGRKIIVEKIKKKKNIV